jgi:hypothetical protein
MTWELVLALCVVFASGFTLGSVLGPRIRKTHPGPPSRSPLAIDDGLDVDDRSQSFSL